MHDKPHKPRCLRAPNSCTIATPRLQASGVYTHSELGLKGIRLDTIRVVADRMHYRAYHAVLCMTVYKL